MDNRRESRKRLRPWLERMIESNCCPGLVWENREERTFRIPWRHFNNKDWDANDSRVFMEWARYTGRFHDGDTLEYPVWKTRLRCALKKIPEIKELQNQHHPEDVNPYRVYQFVDIPTMRRVNDFDSNYSASPGGTSVFTNSPDFLEESEAPSPPKYFDGTFLGPKPSSNVPTVVYDEDSYNYNNLTVKTEGACPNYPAGVSRGTMNPQQEHHDQHFGTEFPDYTGLNILSESNFFNEMPSESQNYFDSTSQQEPYMPTQETSDVGMQLGSMNGSFPSDLMALDSTELRLLNPADGSSLNIPSPHVAKSTTDTCNVMQLTLMYGFPHNTVLQKKVAANGCRLYFGPPQLQNTILDEELFGPKSVTQIEMPDVKQIPQICDEQKRFIFELIDGMERGLVLTYKDGDIYAQRLCRTRIYISDGVSESKLLDRKEKTPTKIFDFAAFKAFFTHHDRTNIVGMPKNYFYLTFGQEIKKNRSDPMGKLVIHVKVLHTEATEFANNFSLADESHSMDPLFSSMNTYDRFLQRIKMMTVNN